MIHSTITLTTGEPFAVLGLDASRNLRDGDRAEALERADSANDVILAVRAAVGQGQQFWDGERWRSVSAQHVVSVDCAPFD